MEPPAGGKHSLIGAKDERGYVELREAVRSRPNVEATSSGERELGDGATMSYVDSMIMALVEAAKGQEGKEAGRARAHANAWGLAKEPRLEARLRGARGEGLPQGLRIQINHQLRELGGLMRQVELQNI